MKDGNNGFNMANGRRKKSRKDKLGRLRGVLRHDCVCRSCFMEENSEEGSWERRPKFFPSSSSSSMSFETIGEFANVDEEEANDRIDEESAKVC